MLLCLERLRDTLETPISKSVCFQEESVVQEGRLEGKNTMMQPTAGGCICDTNIAPANWGFLEMSIFGVRYTGLQGYADVLCSSVI